MAKKPLVSPSQRHYLERHFAEVEMFVEPAGEWLPIGLISDPLLEDAIILLQQAHEFIGKAKVGRQEISPDEFIVAERDRAELPLVTQVQFSVACGYSPNDGRLSRGVARAYRSDHQWKIPALERFGNGAAVHRRA